jgi:hypothetical protein
MQGKRIAGCSVLRQRRIPANDPWGAAEVQPGRRQRRHVQRLADMASGIGPIGVLVEERSARSEIQQCSASQQGQRATYNRSSENGFPRIHLPTLYLSTFDVRKPRLVAKN